MRSAFADIQRGEGERESNREIEEQGSGEDRGAWGGCVFGKMECREESSSSVRVQLGGREVECQGSQGIREAVSCLGKRE